MIRVNVTTGLRPMIALVSRAKEPIRSLGRLVRVALIPQALGLCLIACSQAVGQGPATHGVASACQADSLTELVKKLEAAALDDSFFKPDFVTDSALLRFFGARVITWKNIPSLQARSANLDDFGLPDAPRRTRADPLSSTASVKLRMDNNGIFEVTIFLLQGDSAQDVSYQVADRIFAKAWNWRKSDVPPPPPHPGREPTTNPYGYAILDLEASDSRFDRHAFMQFGRDGTLTYMTIDLKQKK